jgi:Tol biopolymer transport system component
MALALGVSGCNGAPSASPEEASDAGASAATPSASVGSSDPVQPGDEWIAFQWSDPATIYLVRPDGSGLHDLLPEMDGDKVHPAWSPDGERIAFVRSSPERPEELWMVGADGDHARMLISCADDCSAVRLPQWSPDGSSIYFSLEWAGRDPRGEMNVVRSAIERISVDSGRREVIVEAEYPLTVEQARISPSGSRLAYIRFRTDRATAASALFVAELDGSRERKLTAWDMTAFHPDWITDDLLVFDTFGATFGVFDPASPRDIAYNLHVVGVDGKYLRLLTTFPAGGSRAAQARATPDGQGVVFTRLEPADWTIRRLAYIGLDGSGLRWLTPTPTDGTHPQLRPLPVD